LTRLTLLSLFIAFAALATLANLMTQRIVLSIDDGVWGFAAAVFLGTLIGLVIKYILDKKWIFRDRSTGAAAHGKKFVLYTAMGIITTVIFWVTETVFWLYWQTDTMRELGAVIGLIVGYTVKYQLDRRFVFTPAEFAETA
jgi:putative flippase GtrA